MKSTNKWITSEQILKEVSEIGSFKGYIDSLSGTLEWYDKERELTIYATPNWENDGEVPFDVNYDSDLGYHHICTIKMIDGDISSQFTHYLNVLLMIMNHYKDFPKYEESNVDSFKTWNEAPYGNDDEDENDWLENRLSEDSFPHYVSNEEADEDYRTTLVQDEQRYEDSKKITGVTQAILDMVERQGDATYTEMNEFYKKVFGSNSFSHILKALRIPYKNRPTKRYLIKVGKNYEVRMANPSNWVVKEY